MESLSLRSQFYCPLVEVWCKQSVLHYICVTFYNDYNDVTDCYFFYVYASANLLCFTYICQHEEKTLVIVLTLPEQFGI